MFKLETANQSLSLGVPKGPFSFAKENGPFDSHPCAAQGYPRCTCAANSQLLYNLLTLCPFHFQMTCGILKIVNCIGVSFLKHIFIINPAAGKKDSRQRVYTMAEALKKNHNLDVECMLTKSRGHATALTRAIAETGDYVRFYACGGDGTVNEIANGIAGFPNAAMTCIPIGTGNDFLKNFGKDAEPLFLDAENLWNGDVTPLDLIDCNGKYCLTIACTGIDARIAESVHEFGASPMLSGRGSYLASVAVNFLFRKIGRRWRVTLDDEMIEDTFALVSMCNGRYYGGGSTPVPEARMTDGVLHTVLVKNVSKARFATLFGGYSAGDYKKLPQDIIRVSTAKVVRIEALEDDLTTCLDGESMHSQCVTLKLADKKVNFFAPKGCDPDATAR